MTFAVAASITPPVIFTAAVSLVAALIGASAGVWVSRALRRDELHTEVATKIEGYMEEILDLIGSVDRTQQPIDLSPIAACEKPLTRARFHNKRIEKSYERDDRIAAAQAVVTDIVMLDAVEGIRHLVIAVGDVMEAAIIYMQLSPLVLLRRRKMRAFFPTVSEYRRLVEDIPGGGLDYSELNLWEMERSAQISEEIRAQGQKRAK